MGPCDRDGAAMDGRLQSRALEGEHGQSNGERELNASDVYTESECMC